MKIVSIQIKNEICITESGLKPKFRFFFKELKEIKEKLPNLLKITLDTGIFTNKEAGLILQKSKSVRDYIKKINAMIEAYGF